MSSKSNVKVECKISDDIIVEYSNPQIQPHSGFLYVENYSEILYFYYTMKVYKIEQGDNNNKKEKTLLFKKYVYDFPAIIEFLNIAALVKGNELEITTLNADYWNDASINWQYQKAYDNGREYRIYKRNYNTKSNWMCDDFYNVEIVNEGYKGETLCPHYNLLVGCVPLFKNNHIEAVVKNRLTSEEFWMFANSVKIFVDMAIEDHNKKTEKYISKMSKCLVLSEHKLRKYEDKSHEKIESIFTPDDIVEITVKEIRNKRELEAVYHQCKIKGFDPQGFIYFECSYKDDPVDRVLKYKDGDIIYVPIKDITFITYNADFIENRVNFTLNECKNEFAIILTPSENREFQEESVKYLYKKWGEAIADRTWMYRDEHGFKDTKKAIKKIVKQIKVDLGEE